MVTRRGLKLREQAVKVVFVEQDRCLACRNCERVCSFQGAGGFKREHTNIWVHVDMDERSFFTLTCLQCEVPACMEICPVGAFTKDKETGAIVVDQTLCVGCKMCVTACPFGCIHFDAKSQLASKCDLCLGTPRCVQNCMAGALHFGDINELANIKRQKADKIFNKSLQLHRGRQQR